MFAEQARRNSMDWDWWFKSLQNSRSWRPGTNFLCLPTTAGDSTCLPAASEEKHILMHDLWATCHPRAMIGILVLGCLVYSACSCKTAWCMCPHVYACQCVCVNMLKVYKLLVRELHTLCVSKTLSPLVEVLYINLLSQNNVSFGSHSSLSDFGKKKQKKKPTISNGYYQKQTAFFK